MNRLCVAIIVLLFPLFLTAADIKSDPSKVPAWVQLERGKFLFSKHDYGNALKTFQDALISSGVFPEAEMAIGDVYLAEGEPMLAELQYLKAYSLKEFLFIPDDRYTILYKLASIYESQEKYRQMEDTLLSIVKDDAYFSETRWDNFRTQIVENYDRKGIDHVMKLYALESGFATKAHSKLGWFYYKTGRFPLSIVHYLFALVTMKSEIVASLRARDPDAEFTGISDLLALAPRDAELRTYFASVGIYADLYYLAGSTSTTAFVKNAAELWKTLSINTLAGRYRDLSVRQLKQPWIEPFLSVPFQAP